MVYDCFLFNTELDLLKLRLSFLNDVADYFVIVESKRTLSGQSKMLYYKENKSIFEKYKHKIIHVEAPLMPQLAAWDYEFFQRNYIKEALKNCNADDIILISDLDEIVNLKYILSIPGLQLPALIDLPYYYYFFNLKANATFNAMPLLSKYLVIKQMDIGERNEGYKNQVQNVLKKEAHRTGWHFSYLFGFDIPKYLEKIRSFSHQEYNTPYFLNLQRIRKCIKCGIDLFERKNIFFSFKSSDSDIFELKQHITELEMEHLIYKPPTMYFFQRDVFFFIVKKKILPLVKLKLYVEPRYKLIVFTSPYRKKIRKGIVKVSGRK